MTPDDIADLRDMLDAYRRKIDRWRDDPDFEPHDQGYQDLCERASELEEQIERLTKS